MAKFSIGNRVKREVDIYDRSKGIKTGTVKRIYSKREKYYAFSDALLGPYPELYGVLWDNGKYEEGFLPHGLDAINSR